jgi:hypothetical protein
MSKIGLRPGASGTGTFTISSPNSNTDRTLTLPDAEGAVVIDEAGGGSVKIDSSGNVGIGTSTPVAKLDVDGQLRIRNGGATGYALLEYGASGTATNNWHIGSEGDGSFRFYNGNFGSGLERMRIDSAGRVTMPYQPAFHAYGNPVGSTVFNENDTVPFPNARYNIGNHYNTSTSTFTAPVTGIYHIWFAAFNNSSAAQRVQLRLNGYAIFGQGSADLYVDFHQSVTAYMVAGDSIKVTVTYNNTTIYQSSQHTEFGGCLLG